MNQKSELKIKVTELKLSCLLANDVLNSVLPSLNLWVYVVLKCSTVYNI